jgi:hypothetical protein
MAFEEIKTDSGPVDFALSGDGDLRRVVEVKKLSCGSQGDLVHVERCARHIDVEPRYQGDFVVPFLCLMSSGELDLDRLKVGNAWH